MTATIRDAKPAQEQIYLIQTNRVSIPIFKGATIQVASLARGARLALTGTSHFQIGIDTRQKTDEAINA